MSPVDLLPSPADLASRCAGDAEFRIAARFWSGGLRISIGKHSTHISIENGMVSSDEPASGPETIAFGGSEEIWEKVLAPVPERLHTEILELAFNGQLTVEANPVQLAQYYPAISRVFELLRPPSDIEDPLMDETGRTPRFDSPVGRYVHLELDGHDHRVYFEEAGQGIPLLLHHTAGAHGIQYRHLFEVPEITDHFRLIAYDLPFHGKSIPPVSKRWWEEEYRLSGELARSLPVKLAKALGLDSPVFMGCSVGGLLALDLAYHNPEFFRAVISLEGAINIGHQDFNNYALVWHPQVSNDFKARAMNGAMSPTSPVAYRKETCQVYAAGWPPCFHGDLHYYLVGYDLSDNAKDIDTTKCAVYILSGEYDVSGTVELGRHAHETIKGSEFIEMKNVGHFPMCENPVKFIDYLLPVLERIRSE